MLYEMRAKFAPLSAKIGALFKKLGLTPNQISISSLFFALCTAWFLSIQSFILAGIFLIITSLIDVIDGAVARATGKVSYFGGYLDGVVDKYAEGIIAFGLLFVPMPGFFLPAFAWVFLYLFGEMSTTFVKATAVEKGLSKIEIRGGLLEKPERMLLLIAGIFLAAFGLIYLTYVMVLLAILTNITALQRFRLAIKAGAKTGAQSAAQAKSQAQAKSPTQAKPRVGKRK